MTSPSNSRFRRVGLEPAVLLAGLFCLILPTAAAAGALSQDLAALHLVAGGEGQVEVIVSYHGPVGRREIQRIQTLGASRLTHLRLIDGLAVRLPAASLRSCFASISFPIRKPMRAPTLAPTTPMQVFELQKLSYSPSLAAM